MRSGNKGGGRKGLAAQIQAQERESQTMIGINVEAADVVLDDLGGPSLIGGEGGQATSHGLYHCQAEGLVQRRLYKRAPRV